VALDDERSGCTLNSTHTTGALLLLSLVLLFTSVSVQLSCRVAIHDCGSLLVPRCRNPM
jgi:hypothetical protein